MSNARPLRGFAGFRDGASGTTAIPTAFFAELLPLIDDLAELKLTMYLFWALQQREGDYRFVRLADLQADTNLLQYVTMTNQVPWIDQCLNAGQIQRALDIQKDKMTKAIEIALSKA